MVGSCNGQCGLNMAYGVYEKDKDDTLTLLKSVPKCKEKVEDGIHKLNK